MVDGAPQGWRTHVRRPAVIVVGALVVLLVAGGATAWAAGGSGTSGYRTASVVHASIAQHLDLVGTIEPVSDATAAFQVAGQVTSVSVAVGDQVTAGETLASLDPTSLTQSVSSAQSSLQADQAKLIEDEDSESTSTTSTDTGTGTGTATTTTTTAPTGTRTNTGTTGTGGPNPQIAQDQAAVVADQKSTSADQQQEAADISQADDDCGLTTDPPSAPQASCSAALAKVSADQQKISNDQQKESTDESTLAKALSSEQSSIASTSSSSSTYTPTQTATTSAATTSSTSAASGDTSSRGTGTSAAGGSATTANSDSAEQIATDQAAIDSSEASLIEAQQALSAAALTSPISGTVASVGIGVGDTVSAHSSTSNIVIIGTHSFEVTGTLTSSQVTSVKVGYPATITVDGTTSSYLGKVSQVGPVQSSTSGYSYPVVAVLPTSVSGLYTGSTANMSIQTSSAADVLAVPTSAVTTEGTRTSVLTMAAGVPTRKIVKVGIVGGVYTQILSGLKTGDTVVLADLSTPVPASSNTTTFGGFGGAGGGGGRFTTTGAGDFIGGGGRFTSGGGGFGG